MSHPAHPGQLPLLFSFQFLIPGQGFVACVELSGKVLRDEESLPGECWLYGAEPGGFAGGGQDWAAASLDFKEASHLILLDLAAEAENIGAFRSRVEAFFRQRDEVVPADWEEALQEVRERGLQLTDLPATDVGKCPPRVEVREVEAPRPFTDGPVHWATAAA